MDINNFFDLHDVQSIVTIIVTVLLLLIRALSKKIVAKRIQDLEYSKERKIMIKKVINLFLFIIFIIVLLAIWGVKSSDVLFFVSSIATVLGVAFFAQWSILSNVTAGLILFFNHPVKIGSQIKILDKDYPLEGKIVDITSFFIKIRSENGEETMVPSAVILQKSVSIVK